jgi:hypothetical protein
MIASLIQSKGIKPSHVLKGLFITIITLIINIHPVGMVLTILLLIYLYLNDKALFLTIVFYTTLLIGFFSNDKTIEIDNYLFWFFNLKSFGFEVPNYYLNYAIPSSLVIIFFIILIKIPLKSPNSVFISIILVFLFYLVFQYLYIVDISLFKLVGAFSKYAFIPFGIIVLSSLKLSKEKCNQQLKNTSFIIGPLQGIIIIMGSFLYIISPNIRYSGDLIVGTTSTSTNLTFLLSFSILYYFSQFEFKRRSIFLLIFLFVIIFLAQSIIQTGLLLFTGFIIQSIRTFKNRNKQNFLLLIVPSILLISFLIMSPWIFPELKGQLNYAIRRIDELIEFGILYNNKFVVLRDIIEKSSIYNSIDLFFGHGYGTFQIEYLNKYEIQKLFDLSLVTTANTPFLNILYDFGIIGVLIIYSTLIYLTILFVKNYIKFNSDIFLYGLSVVLILILSSFLIFPGFDNYFVSIISIFIFAPIINTIEQ